MGPARPALECGGTWCVQSSAPRVSKRPLAAERDARRVRPLQLCFCCWTLAWLPDNPGPVWRLPGVRNASQRLREAGQGRGAPCDIVNAPVLLPRRRESEATRPGGRPILTKQRSARKRWGSRGDRAGGTDGVVRPPTTHISGPWWPRASGPCVVLPRDFPHSRATLAPGLHPTCLLSRPGIRSTR